MFDRVDHGMIYHIWRDHTLAEEVGEWLYEFLRDIIQAVLPNAASEKKTFIMTSVLQVTWDSCFS